MCLFAGRQPQQANGQRQPLGSRMTSRRAAAPPEQSFQSFAWARLLHVKKETVLYSVPPVEQTSTGNLAAGISPELNLSHRDLYFLFAH